MGMWRERSTAHSSAARLAGPPSTPTVAFSIWELLTARSSSGAGACGGAGHLARCHGDPDPEVGGALLLAVEEGVVLADEEGLRGEQRVPSLLREASPDGARG